MDQRFRVTASNARPETDVRPTHYALAGSGSEPEPVQPHRLQLLRGKWQRFRAHPLHTAANRARAIEQTLQYFCRRAYRKVGFRWPIYHVSWWFLNRVPRKAYAEESARMQLSAVQQRVLNHVSTRGIFVCNFNELFPNRSFGKLQQLAEAHLQESENQKLIQQIREGKLSYLGTKYYLVRLFGNPPIFEQTDKFVDLCLSDEILGLVCSYMGMFSRIVDIDLWCNIATEGPDRGSQRWHRDPDDRKLVKLFLYLRDVDQSTGPFCYIPGTQNGGPSARIYPQTMPDSRYPREGDVEKSFSEDQILRCTGKAGTLILCNTTGFHKGGHPEKGMRLLFTATYTTNAGPLDNVVRYTVVGGEKERLSPAAGYAIGHVVGRKPVRL